MSRLFKRGKQLIIDGKVFPDLDIDFNVDFNPDEDQIVADVTVYNASPDSVANIKAGSLLILNAGYDGNLSNVLVGKISEFTEDKGSVDHVLKIMIPPDISPILNKKIQAVFMAGVTAMEIINSILRDEDIETGNINLTENTVYPEGKIVNDTIQRMLEGIASDTRSFYYQRNNIVYIVPDVYELDTGFLLRPDTGLIGSPEEIEIDGERGWKITCLLNPMLTTGSVFRMESRNVSGLFRVQNGNHSGDFITTMNCLPTNEVSRYVPPVKNSGSNLSSGNTNKDKVWNFLMNNGFSRGAAAGVMGNIEVEAPGYDPAAEHSGGAFGLFQWLGGRRDELEAQAAAAGVAPTDLLFQLQYFMWEITDGPESGCFDNWGGLAAFKQLSDPVEAATIFEAGFERSGGAMVEERQQYAQEVYNWNGGSQNQATGGDGNFPAGAFLCDCGCGLDCVPELKNKMNQVWEAVGGGIVITSGARCQYQNSITPGSVPDSLHVTGEACDSYISGGSVDYLYQAAQNAGLGTIRYYASGFVHCQTYATDQVSD